MMAAAIQHAETTFAAAPVFEERARRGTTVLVPTARHARLAGLLEAATGAKVLPEGTEVIDCTDAGCAPAFDGLTITRVGFESDPGIADGRPLFWVRWLEPSGGRSVATRSQSLDLRLEGSTWVVGAVLSEGWATMIPRPAATGARDGAVR
ncbi:MAG: hypothetical protein EA350_06670 [Gemmatimonadales bacterium]|nr:MAG: hypothetical protein EA350_06670 [Gemmatimonadales bacterium]